MCYNNLIDFDWEFYIFRNQAENSWKKIINYKSSGRIRTHAFAKPVHWLGSLSCGRIADKSKGNLYVFLEW